jgi:hypothetical protein
MKRFILPLILLFPVASLIIWFYFGVSERVRPLPLSPATNVISSTNGVTNK